MLKLVCAILLVTAALPAQVMDATRVGSSVLLQGDWRFINADDPRFAKPDFDDSGWRLVSTEKTWEQQGMAAVHGYVWFRARINLPQQHGPLSLLVSNFGPSEIYVDGNKLGTIGRFPPDTLLITPFPRVWPIAAKGNSISLAIRYWLPTILRVGKLASEVFIGTNEAIRTRHEAFLDSAAAQRIPDIAVQLFGVVFCAGLLILYYSQRDHTEYLFLSLALGASTLNGISNDVANFAATHMIVASFANVTTSSLTAVFLMEFAFRFIREPMPKWLRAYQLSLPLLIGLLPFFWLGVISEAPINVIFVIYLIPFWLFTPGSIIWRFFRGNKEAGLLALTLLLVMLEDMVNTAGWALWELHLRSSTGRLIGDVHVGRIAISASNLFDFFFVLSVAGLILYRFQKTRLDQVRAAAELEAARSMQEVMVPHSVAATGFQIKTAYIPAAEVGGDFFQLFPGDDGSLLVVIGDVSGKGLKAAMLVSMILGLLRRTVDQTRSPGRILSDLNRLLIGHTDGKFATCCCALIYPDGSLTAANAGHLSPYCDGEEIELPGGVPLGLSAEAEYREVHLSFSTSKQLVFLSDGVVEARSKSGELYGFERTRFISVRAVEEIAHTARDFGQEDDITVLGIVAFA